MSVCKMKNVIAVTNRHLCSRPFLEQIERVCQMHPAGMLLREKDLTEEEYAHLAEKILEICRAYQVPCILHTYVNAARQLNCSAIHLPFPELQKRHACPDGFRVVGTSVHSVKEALEAERLGVSYLIAGHIYATDCKKGVPPRGTEFLRSVCGCVAIPVYGIGGIKWNEKQMVEVMECGAEGCCIMSGMMCL